VPQVFPEQPVQQQRVSQVPREPLEPEWDVQVPWQRRHLAVEACWQWLDARLPV